MKHTSLVAIAAAGLMFGAGLAGSGTADQQPQATFRGGVDLVQVDVVVLDKQRRPVLGLTAADFTVTEGGQQLPVEAFAAVRLPDRVSDSGATWDREIAPDVVNNQLPEEGRLVVILMDRSIMSGPSTITAKQIAHAAVDALGPGDLAAVVRNSGFRNDGDVHGFTADKTRLHKVVDSPFMGFMSPPVMTSSGLIETPPDLLRDPSCGCGVCVLESLARIADALPASSRRQKIILFIGSFIAITDSDDGTLGGDCGPSLMLARNEALRAIDRANVTIHSIDPTGLETLANGFGLGRGTWNRRAFNLARQGTLAVFPDFTGGRTVVNTNAPQSFVSDIFDETRSYYLLGFRPSQSNPSATGRHDIQVRVDRDDVSVRSRRAYYQSPAPDSDTDERHDATASIREVLPTGDVPLTLALTPAFRRDGTPDALMLLGIEDGSVLSAAPDGTTFDVVAGIFDRLGRPVGEERQTIRVPRDRRAAESVSRLVLKPGSYEVRVGVADARSGRTGSVYGYVDLPDLPDDGFALSGIVVGAPPASSATTPDDATAVPTVRRSFATGERATAFVQVARAGKFRQPIDVQAVIVDRQSREVWRQADVLDASRFGDSNVANVGFALPLGTLSAGRYLLTIAASVGDTSDNRKVPFDVE